LKEWMKSFIVIGHRGAPAYEPENTLKSFRRAIELGADGIELDVRFTADGVPVVFHDEDLKRLFNMDVKLNSLTLHQIRELKINGESIPVLEEVVREFGKKTIMFIELKEVGREEEVVRIIRENGDIEKTLIISFHPEALRNVKRVEPHAEVGLIVYRPPVRIRDALELKCSAVLPHYSLVTPRLVQELHAHGLAVYVWTVNDVALAKKMRGYGVNGIATDRPDIKRLIESTRI